MPRKRVKGVFGCQRDGFSTLDVVYCQGSCKLLVVVLDTVCLDKNPIEHQFEEGVVLAVAVEIISLIFLKPLLVPVRNRLPAPPHMKPVLCAAPP